MKAFWPILIAGLLASPVKAASQTHCGSDEKVFFSCTIGSSGARKVASICGNANEKNEARWVQYRFGAIGSPEMVYPTKTKDSREKFFAHFENHPEGGFREIWFKVGDYRYLVGDDYSADAAEKVDSHVVVYKGWQPIANLKCVRTAVDDLYSLRERVLDANNDGFYNQK